MSDTNANKAKGGKARAAAMDPEKRREIAKKAAAERWHSDVPIATHTGELRIGSLSLSCAVLPDDVRVISRAGIASAFGPVTGGYQLRKIAAEEEGGDLPPFLVADSLKPFISNDLRNMVSEPRRYREPGKGGRARYGIDAALLPQVCEVWLRARDAGALTKIQLPVAERADILMRGLAHTGVIALVDEATGYQRDRAKDALAKILEAFIAKELQPWIKTFPEEYYDQLFRLRKLKFPEDTVKRPQYFGMLTNDIVYKRLAPGVLEDLKKSMERGETGRPKHKLFQRLTPNHGYVKLREHLGFVLALMHMSATYPEFLLKLDVLRPRYGDTMMLPMDYEQHKDDGVGI